MRNYFQVSAKKLFTKLAFEEANSHADPIAWLQAFLNLLKYDS